MTNTFVEHDKLYESERRCISVLRAVHAQKCSLNHGYAQPIRIFRLFHARQFMRSNWLTKISRCGVQR